MFANALSVEVVLNVARRGDNQMAIAKKLVTCYCQRCEFTRARELSLARTRLRLNDVAE